MHEHELAVDVELVRRLVATQFPAWADLPVRRVVGTATVNAIFRIGDDLTARLPLRADAVADVAEHLRAEARALEAFAAVSPFPAPRPVAVGAPGAASSVVSSGAARSSGDAGWLGRSSRRWGWSGTTSTPTRR